MLSMPYNQRSGQIATPNRSGGAVLAPAHAWERHESQRFGNRVRSGLPDEDLRQVAVTAYFKEKEEQPCSKHTMPGYLPSRGFSPISRASDPFRGGSLAR